MGCVVIQYIFAEGSSGTAANRVRDHREPRRGVISRMLISCMCIISELQTLNGRK